MEDRAELLASFVVLFVLAGVYVLYDLVAQPSGGNPFGHWLGILGTLLMVLTETLYSARKRLRWLTWGRLRTWLSFHIFTGIVGPAMVLAHTGMQFRGLAGLTMWLTVLVVASGFLGRYIFTAVPRAVNGAVAERSDLLAQAAQLHAQIAAWSAGKSARLQSFVQQREAALAGSAVTDAGTLALLFRPLDDFFFRLDTWRLNTVLRALIETMPQRTR